jgi:hypothetical protein
MNSLEAELSIWSKAMHRIQKIDHRALLENSQLKHTIRQTHRKLFERTSF